MGRFGYVTSTPKKPWQFFDLRGTLARKLKAKTGLDLQIPIETDVNSCALLEYDLMPKQDLECLLLRRTATSVAYITVGTGIGIGLMVNKQMVHGLVHPEGGHMRITKLKEDADFKGVCPFHGDCLEGLCTNNAIAARKGVKIEDLPKIPDSDPIWAMISHYLAEAIVNLTLVVSPERVVIGGGVMNRKILMGMIHKDFVSILNRYVQHPTLEKPETYIVYPQHYPDNGVISAVLLGTLATK